MVSELSSPLSTLRYTMTAYKLLPKTERTHGDMVLLTPQAIQNNKAVQRLLFEKAIEVYGDNFDDEKYDMICFSVKQGFAVNHS